MINIIVHEVFNKSEEKIRTEIPVSKNVMKIEIFNGVMSGNSRILIKISH